MDDLMANRMQLNLSANQFSVLVILALILLVTCVRLLPLSISEYPFNNDGLTESRIAGDILDYGTLYGTGDWIFSDSQSVMMPAYNAMLAFLSATVGYSVIEMAHVTVVISSLLAVLGCFLISKTITGSTRAAFIAGMFLALFGTAVYLTGSAWKESLGFSLYVLLFFAFMRRQDISYFALEISILVTLPFVHHLITAVAYLSIGFLTFCGIFFAARSKRIQRRQYAEVAVIGVPALFTFLYYEQGSIQKLAYITDSRGALIAMAIFLLVTSVSIVVLSMRKPFGFSLAPLVAGILLAFFLWDYLSPVFDYSQGTYSLVMALAVASCILVYFSWKGLELATHSDSRYRVIPLGTLIPVVMILAFAFTLDNSLAGHQVIYRSFDLADLSLALGISITVFSLRRRPKSQFTAVLTILLCLLISLPFAYASGSLLGVRHDTQQYEVDAISYVAECASDDMTFQSDERLSYIAMALYDFKKLPTLPSKLESDVPLNTRVIYAFEDEWATVGVNDYPRGHPVFDDFQLETLAGESVVLYVGGPTANHIVLFSYSPIGSSAR